MQPDVTRSQIAVVIATQLVAVLTIVAIEVAATGGAGLLVPIAALFVGGVGAFYALGLRQDAWPQRPAIQRTSLVSGGTFWGLSTIAYATAYAAQPEAFSFGWLALAGLAPLVALLPGLSALILTMCAGDAAATALRSYDEFHEHDLERDDVDLYQRFTARTPARYGKRHGHRDRTKISGH